MLSDSRKSMIMVFWSGEKVPYHMRLMVMFPWRIDPLWYLRTVAGVCTRASFRGMVAEDGWITVAMMMMIKREEAKIVKGVDIMVLIE